MFKNHRTVRSREHNLKGLTQRLICLRIKCKGRSLKRTRPEMKGTYSLILKHLLDRHQHSGTLSRDKEACRYHFAISFYLASARVGGAHFGPLNLIYQCCSVYSAYHFTPTTWESVSFALHPNGSCTQPGKCPGSFMRQPHPLPQRQQVQAVHPYSTWIWCLERITLQGPISHLLYKATPSRLDTQR